MATAILEIRDGVASGPLHRPVRTQGRNCRLNENELPLLWDARCGVRGYVYLRESLAALGHTVECIDCLVEEKPAPPKRPIYNPGPTRYETEAERQAARVKAYRTYYDRTKSSQRHGVCADCGGRTSWSRGKENPAERCSLCHRESRRAKHGTASRYSSGCRCHACRCAATVAARGRRHAMRAWKEKAA